MIRLTNSPLRHRNITEERRALDEFIDNHTETVPYITQSYSWDCGLACAEMALRARGVHNVSELFVSSMVKGKMKLK